MHILFIRNFHVYLQMKSLQKSHDTGSDTSAETIGSDSGRGGSESDMPHSANIPGNYISFILNMIFN